MRCAGTIRKYAAPLLPLRLVVAAMDNPDRLGGAETNTVTQELVVNMVTEASLVVPIVRNTQPEQIGPDQEAGGDHVPAERSGGGRMMELFFI